jgi:hypothetical protein
LLLGDHDYSSASHSQRFLCCHCFQLASAVCCLHSNYFTRASLFLCKHLIGSPTHPLTLHIWTNTTRLACIVAPLHRPINQFYPTTSVQPSRNRFRVPERTYSIWEDYPNKIFTEEESMAYTNSIGSSTSSTKRKRDSETLFYAVKKGKVPGIYQSWPEAQEASGNFEKSFCT